LARQLQKARSRGGKAAPGPVLIVDGKRGTKHLQAIAEAQARLAGVPPPEVRAFRFRHQLAPLGWLALQAAGYVVVPLGLSWKLAGVLGLLVVAVTVAATRHWPKFMRLHTQSAAAWAVAWGLAGMFAGLGIWSAAGLLGWAFPYGFWLERYRWRPADKKAPPPRSVREQFDALAEAQGWLAWLGDPLPVEGGVQHEIICDGAKTNIDMIVAKPTAIAAGFQKAVTTAYAEDHPTGEKHHGLLTILREGTLEQARLWDGGTIDPATGLAVIGRFPDGKPVHETFWQGPEDGTKHTIIAGADGSGKTSTINLSLAIGIASGYIAPVILDPQMGQALPAWKGVVPYACGADDCLAWLRGLHAGMFARSDYMASVWWCRRHGVFLDRCDGECKKPRQGMGFFNPFMIDLPIVEVTIDEAPILLAVDGATALILDMLKLGRKAGIRFRLAAQVPSLAELQQQEIRSILAAGTVVCHRTGDKVTGSYVNLPKNPVDLPKVFAPGRPTWGLGYSSGADLRPGVTMRTDTLGPSSDVYDVAESLDITALDESMARHVRESVEAGAAEVRQLNDAAIDAAARQLLILAKLRSPVTMGQLISKMMGTMPPSTVAEELAQLREAGKVKDAEGDRLVAVK